MTRLKQDIFDFALNVGGAYSLFLKLRTYFDNEISFFVQEVTAPGPCKRIWLEFRSSLLLIVKIPTASDNFSWQTMYWLCWLCTTRRHVSMIET